jgi:hypothetical protein
MESRDKEPLGQVRACPELAEGTPSAQALRLLPRHPPPPAGDAVTSQQQCFINVGNWAKVLF